MLQKVIADKVNICYNYNKKAAACCDIHRGNEYEKHISEGHGGASQRGNASEQRGDAPADGISGGADPDGDRRRGGLPVGDLSQERRIVVRLLGGDLRCK